LNEAVESAHLADATILALANDAVSIDERALVLREVEPHLEDCDLCAGRLAAAMEWPEFPDSSEIVVGRAASARFRWNGDRANLGWTMDQPGIGLSTWRVSLRFWENDVEAEVSTEGDGLPEQWRLSLPLSTPGRLLPTLILTSENRTARFHTDVSVLDEWMTTPILSATLPTWSRLVAGGEDPATMVSLENAENSEVSVQVPYHGPKEYEAVASWLDQLMMNLRGDRLILAQAARDGQQWSGAILGRGHLHVGNWSASFERDGFLDVVIRPAPGEVLKLATDVELDLYASPEAPQPQSDGQEAWYLRIPRKFRGEWAQRKFDILKRPQWLRPFSGSEFRLVEETGAVLGESSSTYELNVSDLLTELGLASDFASFKIILKTGDSNQVAVILEPRDSLPEGIVPPMGFEVRLLGSDGAFLSRHPMRIVPGGKKRSQFIRIDREFDLEHFNGQVKLVVFEKPPDVEVESDA